MQDNIYTPVYKEVVLISETTSAVLSFLCALGKWPVM